MKIQSYPNDNSISLQDKVTGTDADDGKKTKNYTFQAIKDFFLTQGFGGNISSQVVKVSRQVQAINGDIPEIKDIDFIRLYAIEEDQAVKLSGAHSLGKEYYIKNTTLFSIVLIGTDENINGNNRLTIPPNTYWHLIKEDGGTNSITAFKLILQ